MPDSVEIKGDQKNTTVIGLSGLSVVALAAVIFAGVVALVYILVIRDSDNPSTTPQASIDEPVVHVETTTLDPTVAPKPALDGLAKFSTFNYQTETFEIFMEIPSSFRRENIERGARFYGSQADIIFTYYDHPSDEIDELAESLFTEQFAMGYDVPWVEEARAKQDGIVVSTGSLGRAFRRNILMPSSDSTVTMIAFTANPDYLDQHVDLFMRIRKSIDFK